MIRAALASVPGRPARHAPAAPAALCYDAPPTLDNRGATHAELPSWDLVGGLSPGASEPMRSPHLLAAFSLSATGLVLSACSHPAAMQRLVRAVGHRRLIQPRLAGGFAYGPCEVPPPGPDAIPRPRCAEVPKAGAQDDAELSKAAAEILAAAGSRPSPLARRALATVKLLEPDNPKRVAEAVAELEAAAAAAPDDAVIQSDLAAAHLVRAQATQDLDELPLALAAADRAVRGRRSLPEARFNRALVLEALYMTGAARAAWRDYLAVDPRSGWAAEAHAHLAALESPPPALSWPEQRAKLAQAAARGDRRVVAEIVDRHRQATRELAEQELLGAWADAELAGDARLAAQRLDLLRDIGASLAAINGERLVLDTVAGIDAAVASGERRHRHGLATALRDFRDGHRLYTAGVPGRGLARLGSAAVALERAGSPFARRAAFFAAGCRFKQGRYAQALGVFIGLERDPALRDYPGLAGHVAWMAALTRSVQGRQAAAVRGYARALQIFARLGEPENEGALQALLGESLYQLGSVRAAWERCFAALRATPGVRDPRLGYMIFLIAADAAAELGQPETALHLEGEAVRLASRTDPWLYADALSWHGLLADRLGDRQLARDDLAAAREQLRKVGEPAARRRIEADLSYIEGATAADPGRAVERLSAALRIDEPDRQYQRALMAHLARARAFRRSGRLDQAEADLRAALQAYEHLGEEVPDEHEQRERMLLDAVEKTAPVFDEMVSLDLLRGSADRAFVDLDRARTRVLPWPRELRRPARATDRRSAAAPEPLGIARVAARLPAGTTLVQLSHLDDHLLTWVAGHRTSSFRSRPLRRPELERMINGLRTFGPGGNPDAAWFEASAAAYDVFVRPWLADARAGETLVFVTGELLDGVPFACLRDRASGRFLVEDHVLVVAPSASLYLQALQQPASPSRRAAGRMLAVGDPAFDRDLFPHLGQLPGAAAEAAAVAALYPGAKLLTGKLADLPSFLALAPRFRRIHFAGHSLVNERDPLRSLLLFSPSAASPGALHASEVYRLGLAGTELVVLAGCDTEGAASRAGAGRTGMARAFLAAGVRSVVASLWPIDDRPASELFARFYDGLRSQPDPARALRQAQLALLRQPRSGASSPGCWGAFQLIGANAPDHRKE
jgi:CHAT domain-containing protein/tetratricopeptide (TPR) repeat protein